MRSVRKLLLFAASLATALSVHSQTLLSDFSGSTNWGSSTTLLGTGSGYGISGGVANYTVSGPSDSDFSYLRFTGAVGSYTSNWSVRVDVNFTSPGSIFASNVAQFLNVGLMVVRSGVTPGVSASAPTFNAFAVESNLYQNASNAGTRDIRTAVFAPGSATDDTNRYASLSVSTATSTAVQISYDATTHILSAGYDADGATGSYSFTNISTLTADASTWSMTTGDTFSIYLLGNSGYDGATSGLGPSISTSQATFDNLYGTGMTAVPEPAAWAAIAGACAVGLAVWRRRSHNQAP